MSLTDFTNSFGAVKAFGFLRNKNYCLRRMLAMLRKIRCYNSDDYALSTEEGYDQPSGSGILVKSTKAMVRIPEPFARVTTVFNDPYGVGAAVPIKIYEDGFLVKAVDQFESVRLPYPGFGLIEVSCPEYTVDGQPVLITTHLRDACGDVVPPPYSDEAPYGSNRL